MIQDYVNANLLSITVDEDFNKLKKASEEIAKKLLKNKTKIVSYTLSAIDPDVKADNVDVIEVKEAIIKNWSTFTANTKDTPLTYIRAVMLEALDSIADDINIAVLIWFASRNIIKHYNISGEEKRIISDFLSKYGNRINQEANDIWALLNPGNVAITNIDLKEISAYGINGTTLQKHLEDASGPTNEQGIANFESPNKYWPNSNNNWSYQFAPRAAKGIKSAIDPSLKAIVDVVNGNQKLIQTGVNNAIEKLQKEQLERSKSLQLRSELLWWKEACYSPSIDNGYKELKDGPVEIIMAYDYSTFIPVIYPKSVDYFLKEMYQGINDKNQEKVEVDFFLKQFEANSEQLQEIFPEVNTQAGKITLLSFIIGLVWGKYKTENFEDLFGFPVNIKLSPVDFTVWLFHDFQLSKALNSK